MIFKRGSMIFCTSVIFGEYDFLIAEHEFVVKNVVQNHRDASSEDENAGGFDEIVVEREVEGGGNTVGEFVERTSEAEEPSKEGADGESGESVPEEEHQDAAFCDGAFLPGDFGMHKVGEDGGEGVRDDAVEPEEVV